MKTIAVLTYCEWNSFGSILQAYGLKKALAQCGYEETIYKTFRMESPSEKRVKRDLKSVVKHVASLPYAKGLKRAYQNNTAFIDAHFQIEYYHGYEELKANIPECDCYLSGSDQVWNPHAALAQRELLLDFNTYGKKRLSYAASFGNTKMSPESKAYIQKMLETFDAISVREASMVPVIKAMVHGASPLVHIDPTFLVPREEWSACASPRNDVPPRYILVYALYWNSELTRKLKRFAAQTQLPVVSVQFGNSSVRCGKTMYDCDIKEFLWLIEHADYVITSSFHGLAFSIIFHKRFSAVINPSAPSRLTNLLDLFSINHCEMEALSSEFCVDYSAVDRVIAAEREKSMRYLERVLH